MSATGTLTTNPDPLGGCYDTAKRQDLIDTYRRHCLQHGLPFQQFSSVSSPDSSTLFTTSGMQKHKPSFQDPSFTDVTLSDVQTCLRLNDLDEIGDSTHYLDFHMLGLFSFRHWTPRQAVDFWMSFLKTLDVLPDTVTIHPSRPQDASLYLGYEVNVTFDKECVWSDGNIGGFCTEFYKDGVEIGNIVMPNGDCIDCGFGLERIGSFLPDWSEPSPTRELVIRRCIQRLLKEGVVPSNTKQGYVLRKLIRMGLREQLTLEDHVLVTRERDSRHKMLTTLPRLLKKHHDKPAVFFKDTFGIDREDLPPTWPPQVQFTD